MWAQLPLFGTLVWPRLRISTRSPTRHICCHIHMSEYSSSFPRDRSVSLQTVSSIDVIAAPMPRFRLIDGLHRVHASPGMSTCRVLSLRGWLPSTIPNVLRRQTFRFQITFRDKYYNGRKKSRTREYCSPGRDNTGILGVLEAPSCTQDLEGYEKWINVIDRVPRASYKSYNWYICPICPIFWLMLILSYFFSW